MSEEKLTIGVPPPAKVSRLKNMLTKPVKRAPIITLFGEGGVGKTSLFSLFDAPVLIRAEDGSQAIANKNVYMFDLVYTFDHVIEQLTVLLEDDHKFKTVGIDSITKLHTILEKEVLASDPKAKSINQALGGYGAGNKAIAKKHGEIRELCGLLNTQKNMTIVFIAHADMETMDLPDMPSYKRYSIRMNDKSLPYYTDDVDMVALVRTKTFTSKNEEGTVQARSTHDRVISCYSSANSIAKNRFGITDDIKFTQADIDTNTNPLKMIEVTE